jgi:hypothetical protein
MQIRLYIDEDTMSRSLMSESKDNTQQKRKQYVI